VLGLAVGAWIFLLLGMPGHSMGLHEHGEAMSMDQPMWAATIVSWLVMIAAMMFPLLPDPIRDVAARSFWRRRHRAVGLFVTGYLAPWLACGIAAAVVVIVTQHISLQPHVRSSLGFGIAFLWQATRPKRRSVLRCHQRRTIAPFGWAADRDCLLYGSMIGSWCVISCWALMLACALTMHSISAMFAASSITWFERYAGRRHPRLAIGLIAIVAIGYAAQSLTSLQMN
jgi:predicted metal-binding membrane protein